MIINGFGFSGYRSFTGLAKIFPLKKINLIIGKNNCGKSNIIDYLYEQFPNAVNQLPNSRGKYDGRTASHSYSQTDFPVPYDNKQYIIASPVFKDEIDHYINEILQNHQVNNPNYITMIKNILNSQFSDDIGNLWFEYKYDVINNRFVLIYDLDTMINILSQNEWHGLWGKLHPNTHGGNLESSWIPQTILKLTIPQFNSEYKIELIPAIRQIGEEGSQAENFSGHGIIERLAKIQNPVLEKQIDKKKFIDINKFVKVVLESPDAEIEIPNDRKMIIVHMDGKSLPLDSLGTGVHEVIILAAAATILEKTIICIEEPELHLHPLLQKKLVNYLAENTNNQYFLTTHSAHLLDAVDSEVFHVTMLDGISSVSAISNTKERSNICNDLGYKASDILQSNVIIWVEGPSDRIYLNDWLKNINNKLTEGIHYSIMFYGGKLFSHLSANDVDDIDKIDNFISLRSMNRNSIIIFDSDKSSSHQHINNTKKRLKIEFNKGPGFTWVTNGREIENYLDEDLLEDSIKAVHPSARNIFKKGKWENLLKYKNKQNKIITANKVNVAKHYIANNPVDLKTFDLNKQISKLCKFISETNDL